MLSLSLNINAGVVLVLCGVIGISYSIKRNPGGYKIVRTCVAIVKRPQPGRSPGPLDTVEPRLASIIALSGLENF